MNVNLPRKKEQYSAVAITDSHRRILLNLQSVFDIEKDTLYPTDVHPLASQAIVWGTNFLPQWSSLLCGLKNKRASLS
jgi:hypothetical protein